MIQSFADTASAGLFHGTDSKAARAFNKAVWPVIRRKLDLLNAATTLGDLRSPPSNRLEALKRNQKGRHSIRINDQCRVKFRFENGHAYEVRCEDYR